MFSVFVCPFAASISTSSPNADSAVASSETERSAPPSVIFARSIMIAIFFFFTEINLNPASFERGRVYCALYRAVPFALLYLLLCE